LKILIFLLIPLLFLCSCAKNKFKSEFDFANKLARKGLWEEAQFRWKKSLKNQKNTAAIRNNMAIALEQMGKIEEAEDEYKKALKLAPNNSYIKKNYEKFKKNKKMKREKEK